MTLRTRALFGVVAVVLFFGGILVLGAFVPDYSQIRQTVSEIGEVGSPVQVPFAVLLCATAVCAVVFGTAVRDVLAHRRHSRTAFYLILAMAVCAAGVGIFAYPHPLHNVFGTSELIGYQAPVALAIASRRDQNLRAISRISLIGSIAVWAAIIANLVVFDRDSALWMHMKPFYGLVQRALFAAWFGWSAAVGLALSRTDGAGNTKI